MTRSTKINVLFDNYDWDTDGAREECIEKHLESYPEDTNYEPSDDEIWEEIHFQEEINWDEISYQLDKIFNSKDTFLITGSAGRWDGSHMGGSIINSFKELSKAWNDCDYIKMYDQNGRFFIKASHHDGTNCWEVRRLNQRGVKYAEDHSWDMEPRELQEKLYDHRYSNNPWIAKRIWGC